MRAWRLEAKAKDKEKSRVPPSLPPPLTQLPWDIAKDEFGTKGAEFIAGLGRVLLRTAKGEKGAYFVDYTSKSSGHPREGANAEKRPVAYHPPRC